MPILFKRRRAQVQPRAATGFKKFNPGCPTRNCCGPVTPPVMMSCGLPGTTMPMANLNLTLTYFRSATANPPTDPGPLISGPASGVCWRDCHDPTLAPSYQQVTWINNQNVLSTTLIFDGTGHWQSPNIIYMTQRRDIYNAGDDGSGDPLPFCASRLIATDYWQGSGFVEVYCPGNGPAQLRGNFGLTWSADGVTWGQPGVGANPPLSRYYDPFAAGPPNNSSCGYTDNTYACANEGVPNVCFNHAFTYNANITNPTLTPWSWTDGNAILTV